jgi:hypothetical protein
MTITRRGLFKGLIGGAAALATPGIVHGEEAVRRYWALDRTHLDPERTAIVRDFWGWAKPLLPDGYDPDGPKLIRTGRDGDFDAGMAPFAKVPREAWFVHEITGQRFPGEIERDGDGRVWVTSGVLGLPGRYRFESAED